MSTQRFEKLHLLRDSSVNTPRRIHVPRDIQIQVGNMRVLDTRAKSEQPTLVEVYLQLAQEGLQITQSALRQDEPYPFTPGPLGELAADVVWMPPEFKEQLHTLTEQYRLYCLEKGLPVYRSAEVIFVALVRLALEAVSVDQQQS